MEISPFLILHFTFFDVFDKNLERDFYWLILVKRYFSHGSDIDCIMDPSVSQRMSVSFNIYPRQNLQKVSTESIQI